MVRQDRVGIQVDKLMKRFFQQALKGKVRGRLDDFEFLPNHGKDAVGVELRQARVGGQRDNLGQGFRLGTDLVDEELGAFGKGNKPHPFGRKNGLEAAMNHAAFPRAPIDNPHRARRMTRCDPAGASGNRLVGNRVIGLAKAAKSACRRSE